MFQNLFRTRSTSPAIPQINPRQLREKLAQDDSVVVLDVRSAEEYAQHGHIRGSRLMPLPTIMSRHEELLKERPIVCVCRSGARSQVACEQLQRLGFTDVSNLSGGMMAWQWSQ